MMRPILASLARITDLAAEPYAIEARVPQSWRMGDYVLARVVGTPTSLYRIEHVDGEMIPVRAGNTVIGALGERAATLEGVGSFRAVRDGRLHALTSAGLFGAFTSLSRYLPAPLALDYVGHVVRGGEAVNMRAFALGMTGARFAVPTLLLVGTSMSAGKTVTGKLACRLLATAGRDVVAAKLTGAGRYRDILAFRRAGARAIFDFVDGGLPSTVVPEADFRRAIRPVLSHIAARNPELLVAEAGASPLEPYNGEAAIDELDGHVAATILCASDPYAVVGVIKAFGLRPDLVTGPATNTSAAIDLVDRLTGIPALNVVDPAAEPAFGDFLAEKLSAATA
ncbi:MAG: hypothetical protein R3176_07530 [Woeseiaceae bacterium]|nr:hypothetical protein [Woeseiaceae bacterium]